MAQIGSRSLRELRRDFHRYPEAGWKEFRTTALVATDLENRGFEVHLGAAALDPTERLGVPEPEELEAAKRRSLEEGAPNEYVDRMDDVTGLVGIKEFGDGPVVGLRVDMDALERSEASDEDHRPAREGFASIHPGEMHACGHDGHTAIGLGVARELDEGGFDGTLKLFFQPAEEGGRGGKSMSETSHLDDVDYLFGLHLGLGHDVGTVVASYDRPLANAKLDVTFSGEAAHAGGEPNEGRNALQAAAAAIQNLYGIPRHADGMTRVNVGMVDSPNAQNVIAEEVTMRVEVRGRTAALNEYMLEHVRRVLSGAAEMHDVEMTTSLYGTATSFVGDEELAEVVTDAARDVEAVEEIVDHLEFGASEDASFLIQRVQDEGGKAVYIGVGASNVSGHHTDRFDFDETALPIAVDVVSRSIRHLSA